MGKIIRKVIAGLLCITAIILMLIPSSDASATTQKGDYELEGSTLVKYLGNETSVTLPNTITAIGNDAFSNNSNITKVVIPDSVKSIGYSAFKGCNNLLSAKVGNGVKSIGAAAFSDCINLQDVNIPAKCDSLGSGVFAGCTSLSNVNINDDNRFYICLDGVIYSRYGTDLIQYLPGRTSSTYSMPASVEKIGEYAFWGSNNLTTVSVSNGVKEIPEYAFSNCNSLNKVSLPQSVESLFAYSFADCPNLKSIYIPDSVGYIDDKAFYLTNGAVIEFIDSSGNTTDSVKVSDVSGNNGVNLSDDSVSGSSNGNYSGDSGSGFVVDENLYDNSYTPSYSGDSNWVTKIKNRDFSENKSQNELGSGMIVGGNAMFIMSPDMPVRGYDLNDAESEDSLALAGGNTSNRNDEFSIINGVLAKYNGQNDNINIPDGINRIGKRAFYKNSNINSVNIPSSVDTIDEFAFARSGLTNISIPNGVKDIGYAAFYHCDNLSDISIPNSVQNIELGAFDGTAWLNNWKNNDDGNDYLVVGNGILLAYKGSGGDIDIPSSVKAIGAGCFEGNKDITGVTIPSNVIKVGEDAFNGCTNLDSLTLSDGLELVEDRAFCDTGISVLNIPDSVKQIGLGAFDTTGNMTPLKTVIFSGSDVPNVTYKDTATRMSANNLRVDALNGVENAIVQADSNLDAGTLFNPKFYGFHGQIYAVSDDSTDSLGTLSLLRTNKKPDESGVVNIDSTVPIGNEKYMMNGVKEHAFDNYLNYTEWCDVKPEKVMISGNTSDDLTKLLSDINERISIDSIKSNEISVSLEGNTISGTGSGYANIPGFEGRASVVISENDNNKDALMNGLYNYYGPNVDVSILPLDISLYDSTGTILIHKLGESKMEVSIPVPSKFDGSEAIKVGSLDDNGALTELSTSLSNNNGTEYLNFVANHCSIYGIYTKNDSTVIIDSDNNSSQNDGVDLTDNPRVGRNEVNEDEIVEVTTVINADDSNTMNNEAGVVKTLNKRISCISPKWFVIVILFGLAGILALYRPSTKRKLK